jgi:N-acetylglucosamine repressor
MLTKQSQSNVKLNNLRLILNSVIKHDPLSRADLVRLTHISKPTVSNLIDELIQRNLVLEIGVGRSSTGRKPILVKFNSTRKYFLAFDLGREEYQVAVSDLKGHILDQQQGAFEPSQTSQEKIAVLHAGILALLNRLHLPLDALLKIHGGAPGVYAEKGKAMRWFANADLSEEYDLQQFFKEKFQTPVLINHSTKLSLLGEKIDGKAKTCRNAVYVDLGYGLGCAFMFDDRIYFGAHNSAGEIGYFYSDLHEFTTAPIAPYEFGALENRISGKALQQQGMDLARKYQDTKLVELVNGDLSQITAKTIFTAARQGDPQAYVILKEAFKYLNLTLCNIINMLDPELVILGGGIANAGDFLLEFIVHEVRDNVLIMPDFALSESEHDASIIGAIAYLIEHTDFLTEL